MGDKGSSHVLCYAQVKKKDMKRRNVKIPHMMFLSYIKKTQENRE